MMKISLCVSLLLVRQVASFASVAVKLSRGAASSSRRCASGNEWQGEVVPNEGGMIRGCSVQAVGEEPSTEWILKIDGVEADLGRFSEAVYKKIISDAKQQRFQGFRPGTIPPHILPTYIAFSMDECARETVLEAMQQNNIRPFSNTREDMTIGRVSIPPPEKKTGKNKKKGGKRKEGLAEADSPLVESEDLQRQWLSFENMKGAIDAGWKPGQSFSFVATNVKGQKVLSRQETEGARPLGLNN